MKKTRKEKLIEEIENSLRQIEKLLIDTPGDMTNDVYQKLTEEADLARKSLEIMKNM